MAPEEIAAWANAEPQPLSLPLLPPPVLVFLPRLFEFQIYQENNLPKNILDRNDHFYYK